MNSCRTFIRRIFGLGQEPLYVKLKLSAGFLGNSIVHINTCCTAIHCHSGGVTVRDLFTSSQLLGAVLWSSYTSATMDSGGAKEAVSLCM